MNLSKVMKVLLTGLLVITFVLALNIQIVVNVNNSTIIENNNGIVGQSEQNIPSQRDIISKFKFNSTGVNFGSPTVPQLLVNNLVDVDAQVANDSFVYWNVTLDQYLGYYITVESLFTSLVNGTHSNDLDMDILFPNGSNWLVGESSGDNEILGPTQIPEKGVYIVVLYPKTNPLNLKTIMGNQVVSIRLTIVDLPTLQDNDVNYDYYGSIENVYNIPGAGGPAETITVRSKTKISVNFGYTNIGTDVQLDILNSTGSDFVSTTQNGTYFIFEDEGPDVYSFFLFSTNLSIPVFMNISYSPYEDTLARTYEVFTGNYDFLWESQTFNPDDFENSYFSNFGGYQGPSSHLENYKIYLYASSTLFLDVQWIPGVVRDLSDDLVRFFNYEGALSRTFTKIIASNSVDHSVMTVDIPQTGWYIIQVGNRALSVADTTGDGNGDANHVYNMDIVVNDKYDVGGNNDSPATPTDLSGNDERIGMTDNSTTLNNDDYYRVPVSLGSRLVVDIEFDYSRGSVFLYILNSTLEVIGTSNLDQQNQQHLEILVFSDDSYFILVNSTSGYDNYYNLYVSVGPIDDSYEPNDSFDEAKQLPGSGSYDLFLAKSNQDWFFLSLFIEDIANISLDFDGSVADINLFIYDSNGHTIGSSTTAASNHEEVVFDAPSTDIFLIRVVGVPATFIQPGLDYQLSVYVVENDDLLEPNDASSSPRVLQDGYYPELKIRSGDEDWYRIYLKAGENLAVSVEFDPELGDLDIVLYDLSVTTILASSQGFLGHEEINYLPGSNQEVLLRVVLFDGLSVIYKMTVEIPEFDDSYGWEDNDHFGDPTFIEPGVYPNIEARGGDLDFYSIYVPNDYAIIAQVTSPINTNFVLYMYTEQQALIDLSDSITNTESLGPIPVGRATHLFIVVYMYSPGITSYQLNLTLGLESVLIPPPTTVTGVYITPTLGFPTFTPALTTGPSSNQTITLPGPGLDIGTTITMTTLGLGLGVGGTIGGNLIYKKRFKK